MSEQEYERREQHQETIIEVEPGRQVSNRWVQVHLNIHPLASLLATALICLIILVSWATWAIIHHQDFTATVLGLAHDSLWFVKALAIVGLVWLCVQVAGSFIKKVLHPLIGAVHMGLAAAGQLKRNKILARMEQYAITDSPDGPQFHQVSQERYNYTIRGETAPPAAASALPPPSILYARSLYEDGSLLQAIQAGKILMGRGDNGQILRLARSKYFSTIDAGIPSSGKTTTAYWQIMQQIVVGARLILIDPHMYYTSEEGEKSLAQELAPFADSFLFPPCDASLSGPIMQRVKYMRSLVDQRKRPGYIAKVSDTVLLVMDECNSVFDLEDILEELSNDLAYIQREGRKYNVHTMLIGHRFSKDDIGSVKIRTIASTVMVHRFNDENQAGLLLGKSNAKKALTLHPGSYWFSSINSLQDEDGVAEIGPVRVQTPMISAADAPWIFELKRRVTVLLARMESETSAPTSAPLPGDFQTGPLDERGSAGFPPEKPVEVESDPIIDPELLSKMYKVMELDETGECTQSDLIAQVWGPEYTSGRRLYEAQGELKQIRRAIAARLKQYRSIA